MLSFFQPQLDNLDRDIFTLVAFDPRGYGWSRPPRRDFPEDFLLRDARDGRELMRALGYTRFSVLGWSAGGISALLLAATYPDDVNKLVLSGSFAYMTDTLVEKFEALRDIDDWTFRAIREEMITVYGEEYFRDTWSNFCYAMIAFISEPDGDICKNATEQITCPTLIAYGKLDGLVSEEHPIYLAKKIHNSQ
ncbi:valacyclovir hydrolase-like [Diadema setosum]|uniref:valacyclovir hydrolase-like n=1 Tax=Diadema setosum TaxID=31175 RepID=UPI003B3AFBD4